MGFDFAQIILFFGLKFGTMGLLSPFSPYSVSRIGIVKSNAISIISLIVGSLLLIMNQDNVSNYFLLTFIFFSIAGAINNPIEHMISALYINPEQRGKINGIVTIIQRATAIISIAIVGLFLNNAIILYIFIITTLFISLIPYKILVKNEKHERKYSIKEPFKHIFSSSFRQYIPTFSMQSFPIIERSLIALFVYVLVGDIIVLSSIIIVASVIEMIIIYVFGKVTDRSSKKTFFVATSLRSLVSLSLIFLNFTTFLLYIMQTFFKITNKVHQNVFGVLTQRATKEQVDPIIFTTSKEMVLCFTEFIILMLFSFTALFIEDRIFVVIFLSSCISVWIMYFKWRNK